MGKNLLKNLAAAKWNIAFKTYGSNHSTLIGLLVDWWIAGNPQHRYVLEPGFSFGYHQKNIGGGICDAVLVEKEIARGIVEVEGSRYLETLKKINKFFQSKHWEYKTLKFGILLVYQTTPRGRGEARKLVSFPLDKFIKLGRRITAKSPDKQLIILLLEKKYVRIKSGLRARSEYYMGNSIKVAGTLICNGQETSKIIFQEIK